MATEQINATPCFAFSRRQTLTSVASGFGYLAFSGLAHEAAAAAATTRGRSDSAGESSGTLLPKKTHHRAFRTASGGRCKTGRRLPIPGPEQ